MSNEREEDVDLDTGSETSEFVVDDYTFSRRQMPGRKTIKGTADETNYHIERKLIHGVMVDVKVYESKSVKEDRISAMPMPQRFLAPKK